MAAKKKPTDAIALLKADHEKVRGLLSQLEKAQQAARRLDLLAKIAGEVDVHATIEEEIFYPAFREAAEKKDDLKLFFEAHAEHNVVKIVIPDIQREDAATPKFAGKAKVLKDLIEHHAEEEEKEMFPRARKLLSKDELVELGQRLQARKGELGRGPRAGIEVRNG
jgi:hemerythrin superfamily protein